MARRKNRPELVRVKCSLAERLREIRIELYGERGGSEMARRLGVPVRTWYNYEAGVTVPAEVLLRFIELTHVEPIWLHRGQGSRFRSLPNVTESETSAAAQSMSPTVESLLRTALQRLEQDSNGQTLAKPKVVAPADNGHSPQEAPTRPDPQTDDAMQSWLSAQRDGRVVRIEDDAMMPILVRGAHVAYAADPEPPEDLDGSLVVAWFDGKPIVRWMRRTGAFGLLTAENPDHVPATRLVEFQGSAPKPKIRRVLWISTTH